MNAANDTPFYQPDLDAVMSYLDSGMAVLALMAHERMNGGTVPAEFPSPFWAALYSLRQAKEALGA